MDQLFIIITGRAGTGKTTLAHQLETDLRIPAFCKDEVKEVFFDQLGWGDKEWSQKLSITAYRAMDYVIESQLKTGRGMIVESNFIAKFDSERIAGYITRSGTRAVQILLHTNETVRAARFQARIDEGRRHRGHHALDAFQAHLPEERYEPLALNVPLIEIDTTDFSKFDYSALIDQIKRLSR